jgi:hypothetical protein
MKTAFLFLLLTCTLRLQSFASAQEKTLSLADETGKEFSLVKGEDRDCAEGSLTYATDAEGKVMLSLGPVISFSYNPKLNPSRYTERSIDSGCRYDDETRSTKTAVSSLSKASGCEHGDDFVETDKLELQPDGTITYTSNREFKTHKTRGNGDKSTKTAPVHFTCQYKEDRSTSSAKPGTDGLVR